jgi:hypothetical protein
MKEHPGLADYGGFAGDFLECLSTYMHAVPALQAGNAWMLGEAVKLLAAEGNTSLAAKYTAAKERIVDATLAACYVGGADGGFWASIYPSNSTGSSAAGVVGGGGAGGGDGIGGGGGGAVQVRTIVDFQAVTKWILEDLTPIHRQGPLLSGFCLARRAPIQQLPFNQPD